VLATEDQKISQAKCCIITALPARKPEQDIPYETPRLRWAKLKWINLYRMKVAYAVTQVRVKCLKNSGRQWTLWHLNAVR